SWEISSSALERSAGRSSMFAGKAVAMLRPLLASASFAVLTLCLTAAGWAQSAESPPPDDAEASAAATEDAAAEATSEGGTPAREAAEFVDEVDRSAKAQSVK